MHLPPPSPDAHHLRSIASRLRLPTFVNPQSPASQLRAAPIRPRAHLLLLLAWHRCRRCTFYRSDDAYKTPARGAEHGFCAVAYSCVGQTARPSSRPFGLASSLRVRRTLWFFWLHADTAILAGWSLHCIYFGLSPLQTVYPRVHPSFPHRLSRHPPNRPPSVSFERTPLVLAAWSYVSPVARGRHDERLCCCYSTAPRDKASKARTQRPWQPGARTPRAIDVLQGSTAHRL
jgi:hypothetical protein